MVQSTKYRVSDKNTASQKWQWQTEDYKTHTVFNKTLTRHTVTIAWISRHLHSGVDKGAQQAQPPILQTR